MSVAQLIAQTELMEGPEFESHRTHSKGRAKNIYRD